MHLTMPEGKEHFAEGFAKANVPAIPQLVEMAQELGCEIYRLSNDNGCYGLNKRRFY